MRSQWVVYAAPVRETWRLGSTEAAEALESLYARVQQELQDYRAYVQRSGASASVERVDASLEWHATQGRKTFDTLRRAAFESAAVARQITQAAKALVRLADIARGRDLENPANRERLLDWAEQALATLAASVELSSDEDDVMTFDPGGGNTIFFRCDAPSHARRYVALVQAPSLSHVVEVVGA